MIKVVGVRFRTAGKIYYFDPQDYEITLGSHNFICNATLFFALKKTTEYATPGPIKLKACFQGVFLRRSEERRVGKECGS